MADLPVQIDIETFIAETSSSAMPVEHSEELDAIAVTVRAGLERMQRDAFEIGRQLLRAKRILGRGKFLPWLDAQFGCTPRIAQHLMNVANRLGGKCESLSHLGLETLYRLASPSTPETVIDAVVEKVETGEKITLKVVAGMIRDAVPARTRHMVARAAKPSAGDRAPSDPEVTPQEQENFTMQAFSLLKAKMPREKLKRMAYLLPRCDTAEVARLLEAELATKRA